MKRTLPSRLVIFSALTIILCSAFLHFYKLGTIQDKIFDEVYFPVFAQDYLTHTSFFDAHPPLGKLIIAASIHLFGNNAFGWRAFNAVTGILLLTVIFFFTYDLTKKWRTALLALLLVAAEPMLLVESRVGLINIYLAFFSLAGLWTFWMWYEHKKHPLWLIFLSLVLFSLAASVKWIGIGAFGAAIAFLAIEWFRARLNKEKLALPLWQLIFIILMPAVYLVSFIPDILSGQDLVWWHQNAFWYHAHLTATHPYGSSWWSWAIMKRPIWLYFQANPEGKIQGIIEIGNIITWIAGLFALLATITYLPEEDRKTKSRNLFLIITYLALYLPWIFIGRVKFIYHYFVPVLLLLILLAVIIDEKLLPNKYGKWLGIGLVIAGVGFFAYFLPLLMGLPISQSGYQHHMWLQSWI